jgi:hypothetical protein
MIGECERLNRIAVAELQRAVLIAGFDVVRPELLNSPTMLTPSLGAIPGHTSESVASNSSQRRVPRRMNERKSPVSLATLGRFYPRAA